MSADAISGNAIFKSAGEGDTHDSLIGLSGQAWQIQSVVIGGGQWTHYLNDDVIDSGSGTLAASADYLTLGGTLQGDDFADSSVAALLIYDVQLNAAEHQSVLDYLRVKYAVDFQVYSKVSTDQ